MWKVWWWTFYWNLKRSLTQYRACHYSCHYAYYLSVWRRGKSKGMKKREILDGEYRGIRVVGPEAKAITNASKSRPSWLLLCWVSVWGREKETKTKWDGRYKRVLEKERMCKYWKILFEQVESLSKLRCEGIKEI